MPPRHRRVLGIHKVLSPLNTVHIIPVEIFSEIFLFTVHVDPRSKINLMLVCRRWHAIMLSIPGIVFQLRIQKSTQKKDVEAITQRRRSLLDVIVDMDNERDGGHFSTRNFYASFMAAVLVASRWRSLDLVSFPPPGKYKDLEITEPLDRLQSLKLRPGCRLNNFLRPFMTALTTTPTLNLTVLEVADPDASLYIVQPACLLARLLFPHSSQAHL